MSLFRVVWDRRPIVSGLANYQNQFVVAAAVAAEWADRCLRSNLTYYRLRRELFEMFVDGLTDNLALPTIRLTDEQFIVIRTFLTARNDALDDNKRLAFDKAVLEVRAMASRALQAPHPAP